jgi:hypothetical protein
VTPAPVSAPDWFERRVRPLVGEPGSEGIWQPAGTVPPDAALAAIEDAMRRDARAPARAAMTMTAGWLAGWTAWVLAVGVLRDGILVRASRPGVLDLLLHPEGYLCDARVRRHDCVVVEGHGWDGRASTTVVADDDALHARAVREIADVCGPVVDAIARRSGRGRAGLWAQVADSLADAAHAVLEAEPDLAPAAPIAAVERLLRAPGAPWTHRPRLWLAGEREDPVLVKHRGSCCLYYRCDQGRTPHCDTCLFRTSEDVQARVLAHAAAARPDDSHDDPGP